MSENTIREIIDSAHGLCKNFNLFAGYIPKETESKKKEVLFWRNVVNIYGVFCDCDKCIIKEKENLIQFFYDNTLITRKQYQDIRKLYFDISALRAWFCHNNDENLFFSKEKAELIRVFLDNALMIASNKPTKLEDVKDSDWDILNMNIVSRFDNYLLIMKEAMENIKSSPDKEFLLESWCHIYANALFNDTEVISNVLASIYFYLCFDAGLSTRGIGRGKEILRSQLANNNYSINDIINVIKNSNKACLDNAEIIRESMSRITFEI